MRRIKKFLGGATLGVGLCLSATSLYAGLNSSPAVLQFPDVNFGSNATSTVVITHDGTGGAHDIVSVSVVADVSGSFAISNDTCSGSSLNPSPAQNCSFDVTFDPTICQDPGINMGAIAEVNFDDEITFLDVGLQGQVLCSDTVPTPSATPSPTMSPVPQVGCDVIQFSQPIYSFHEGDAQARVWVTRTGCGSGVATADYTIGSQTAVQDTDFALLSPLPQTVSFGDGSFIPQPITFDISGSFQDLLEEYSEKFSVILSNPRLDGQITSNIVLGSLATAEAEIVDDDVPGVIQFSQPEYYFQEGNLTAQVWVTRNGGTSGDIGAEIFVTPLTASNADFTAPAAPIAVTFVDGDDSPKPFVFSMTPDTLMEGDESFSLVLGNTTGGVSIGTQGTTTVHIVDDDVNGVIQFGQIEYFFDEGNLNAQVAITRTGGSSGAVSAVVSVNNGSTEGAVDFTPAAPQNLVVNFADGVTDTQYLTFQILQDSLQEGDESFILTLGGATGGASIGTRHSADVHIIDDDVAGVIQFSAPEYYFKEGNMMASVVVTRTGGSSGAVSASVTVNPQTADLLGDFVAPVNLTVSFADGVSTPQTLTFQMTQDTALEGDEFFQLVLGNPTNGVSLGTQSSTTVHIIDDDVPGTIQFSAPEYYFVEGNLQAQVLVTRVGGSSGAVSAMVTVNPQTATQNVDFLAPANLMVQFADGDTSPYLLTFQINQDTFKEGDEYFKLILSSPTGGASLGALSTSTVHIIDDDVPGTIQFSAPNYFFAEGNLMAQVIVNRVGGSSGPVSASLSVVSGTATEGTDFTSPALPIQVNFNDGETAPQAVTFSIDQDVLEEGEETFSVILSDPSNGASLGDPWVAVVHIIDDDVAGTVRFSASSYTFKETVGSAIVFVNREGGSSGPLSVHYATSNGTATSPEDYSNVEGVLTWVDGDNLPKPIVVPVYTDSEDAERRLSVILDGVSGEGHLGDPHIAEIIILDAGVDGLPAGPSIEGGPNGGCSLANNSINTVGSASTWVLLMAAFAFMALRRSRIVRGSLIVLALTGSLAFSGCGDESPSVRHQATEKDYQDAIRVLSGFVADFTANFNSVGNCAALNDLDNAIVAEPLIYCDSGYFHLVPEVNACEDSAGLSGSFSLSVVPEECIIEAEGAEVDGDFSVQFAAISASAPYEADITTHGLTVNDIKYLFYDLRVTVDQNGAVTCYGGLSDGVSSCYIAPDCMGCQNLN